MTSRLTGWMDLANPTRFVGLADKVVPWLATIAALILAVGLYMSFAAPEDFQQGITVRIMYIHVPFAWLAMMCYTLMAVSALGTLVWRHPLADVALKSAAPIGAVFTALALITGSIWGKPMWGTWWVWDARLTSELILLFLYLGYMALVNAIDDTRRADQAGALLAVIGSVNVPIIYFSVKWWNTLHQGATISASTAPKMVATMLTAMLLMTLACWAYAFAVVFTRTRAVIAERERDAKWLNEVVPS